VGIIFPAPQSSASSSGGSNTSGDTGNSGNSSGATLVHDLPPGGNAGDVLVKASGQDYDASWMQPGVAGEQMPETAIGYTKEEILSAETKAMLDLPDDATPDDAFMAIIRQLPEYGATIVVTSSTGATVTCANGNTVLTADEVDGTWTFTVPRFGTWAVTATSGEFTNTRHILVDAVAQFKLAISCRGIDTDFPEKDATWIEEGGSLNYGDGLYMLENGEKGTITDQYFAYKYLTIPLDSSLSAWTLQFSTYLYASKNSDIGGCIVTVRDASGDALLQMNRSCNWYDNTYQSNGLRDSGGNSIYDPGLLENSNGVTFDHKIVYDGTLLTLYKDGVLVAEKELTLNALNDIRITFSSPIGSSYTNPTTKIGYLRLE
jgi:hypothetical protein